MAVKTGRRPLWNDYHKLHTAIDEYFEACKAKDEFPDYAGMLLHLSIGKSDVEALVSDENPNFREYRRLFEMARLKRESWLARHMVKDQKQASGCMNALKQLENGGYMNKPGTGGKVVHIKVSGLAKGEESFK